MGFAEFCTLLANAYAKKRHILAVNRSRLERMESPKTYMGTFIQNFDHFFRHVITDRLNINQ